MSTTDPKSLLPNLSYPAAVELATQIDGTASAQRLTSVGFPGPLAVELAAQMGAGTGITSNLVALGMSPLLAATIKTAIDA